MTTLSRSGFASHADFSNDTPSWRAWKSSDFYNPNLPLFKKGIERWVNDFIFRDQFSRDEMGSLASRQLLADPFALKVMIDAEMAVKHPYRSEFEPELVNQYRSFIKSKKSHCIEIRDSYPTHPKWSAWRRRMVASTLWRDSPQKHAKLVHAPFTIELTKGCTVGCWFCGVDAEKYQGHVEINGKTEAIWRSLLHSFRSIAGQESAQHGFCYWATDPLDHPEYEWFLNEFHQILGYWPQTTTAQVHKYPHRMRNLLDVIKNKNAFVQRFSMTRSTDLDYIHDFFTPEELFLCELIPQYDDRLAKKATAGRVRNLVLSRQEQNKPIQFHHNLEATGSIACVSGFLGNLVQQSLKLITPCSASDRWPLGYRILSERHFDHPDEIEPLILEMLNTGLNDRLLPDDPLIPYSGIIFTSHGSDQLSMTCHGYQLQFTGVSHAAQFAEILTNAPLTVRECCDLRQRQGIDPIQTCLTLTRLFQYGIFDEQFIDAARSRI
jgi:radical SAM family RiPP maturation amino acid epimerase